MNNKEQQDLQVLMQKKQKLIQNAIQAIQKGDMELGIQNVNFDAGLNLEIIKILEKNI